LSSDANFTLTISPASSQIIGLSGNLAFGNVITGTTATATLTITNSGNSALTVSSITYPIGFSGAFSGVVSAGNAVNVTVTFAPTAVANYSGTVTVNANQTSGTSTINASGTGVPLPSVVIALSGNLAFGNVITGSTVTATLTIANTGNTNLTVASISYPIGFSGAFSGVIAPGGSTNITVTFAPTSVTNYSGFVTVTSDATGGTNTFVASGSGVLAPTPPTITTSSLLPTGTVDLAYSQALAATGGATPYQWSVASGRLPAGLALSVGGVIGGTPLVATNASFTVRVTGADGLSSTGSFNLVMLGVTGFVTGRYDGLATFTNSTAGQVIGSVRVVVTKKGAFHAQIKINGTRYSGHGQFDTSGNWTGTLGDLSGTLRVDVANVTDQITGTLTDGGFTGSLLANRAVFSTANPPQWVGTYTTLLSGPDDPSVPSGIGWANVQVSSTGWVALKGQLADGSRFREMVPISKYGTWPLYDVPAGLYSLVAGWVTMTNASVAFETGSMLSDINADLLWYRPTSSTSRIFPAGFTTELILVGSSYTIPAPGTTILPVTDNTCNTVVIFGGGSLPGPVTNSVTLTMTDQLINCSGGTLSLSVNPTRGAFTGSYVLPGTTKPVGISGLFLQNGSVGGGSFFETDTTGYVTIEPVIEPAP
jgi:putative Ig domain-containing protein/HYDIN/CFA65/VesB family protein